VSEGKEHRVKNDDEIDESHKLRLKFEYDVYLLKYTIKIKNLKTYAAGLLRFSGFLKPKTQVFKAQFYSPEVCTFSASPILFSALIIIVQR